MRPGNQGGSHRQARGDRTAVERTGDPYRAGAKWPEPTSCPECGAIFQRGRWQWGEAATNAEHHLCPACLRIRDHIPAGELTLSGAFFNEHRDEILQLIHNTATRARAEHPLQRIIELKNDGAHTVVTFTDSHLAHGVGEALHHAYRGDLDSHWTDEGDLMRVSWSR